MDNITILAYQIIIIRSLKIMIWYRKFIIILRELTTFKVHKDKVQILTDQLASLKTVVQNVVKRDTLKQVHAPLIHIETKIDN